MKKSNLLLIALVTVILVLEVGVASQRAISQVASSDSGSYFQGWNYFIGNYNDTRDIANSEINSSNLNQLKTAWTADPTGDVTGMPVISNGAAYFGDWNGWVYSVNLTTGSTIWKQNMATITPGWTTPLNITDTLAVVNGVVYGGFPPYGPHPEVFALNQSNGNKIWEDNMSVTSQTTSQSIWASPTIYNGILYIGIANQELHNPAQSGQFVALNATTGALIWKFNTMIGTTGGASVWSTATIDPTLNSIYFGTGNPYSAAPNDSYAESMISLNAMTGALNWVFALHPVNLDNDEDVSSSPNLFTFKANGTTYQAVGEGSKDGNYYILNRVNGHLLENLSITPGSSSAGIYALPGVLYTAPDTPELFIASVNSSNENGVVAGFFPSNDSFAWTYHDSAETLGSLVVVPGAVIFPDNQGFITALSPTNGNVVFRKAFSSYPGTRGGINIAGNAMFFGTYSGVVAVALNGTVIAGGGTTTTTTTTSSTTNSTTTTTPPTTTSNTSTTSTSTSSASSSLTSSSSATSITTTSTSSKVSSGGFPILDVAVVAAIVIVAAIVASAIFLRRR